MKKVFITLAAFAALGFSAALAQDVQVSGSSCSSSNGVTVCNPVTSDNNGNYSSSSSSSSTQYGGIYNCVINGVVIDDLSQCPAGGNVPNFDYNQYLPDWHNQDRLDNLLPDGIMQIDGIIEVTVDEDGNINW